MAQSDDVDEKKKFEDNNSSADDISKISWIANTIGGENEPMEKLVFGRELGDRRTRIISGTDNRLIIKCIGLIESWPHKDSPSNSRGVGTGTVFGYNSEKRLCYVLTCAHNIVKQHADKKKAQKCSKMIFYRIQTNEIQSKASGFSLLKPKKPKQTHKVLQRYYIEYAEYHADYTFRDACDNDLAVLVFKDHDGYYGKLFKTNKDVEIKLYSSDKVASAPYKLTYELYGYPVKKSEYSQVVNGGLYGMKAKSYSKIKMSDSVDEKNGVKDEIEMYVKLDEKKTMYIYNAFDTEGGQSGSVLFIQLNNGFGIVGVHTGGQESQCKNWAVALNNDKIKWINTQLEAMIGKKY